MCATCKLELVSNNLWLIVAKYRFLHKKLLQFKLLNITLIYVISCLHLLQNVFTNLSLLEILLSSRIKILNFRNSSTIFRRSHRRCSIRKAVLKHFVIFTGNTCVDVSFLIELQAIRSVTLLKRDSNTYFLAEIGKFKRRPILKNIWERLHFWKVFCEKIFQIRN